MTTKNATIHYIKKLSNSKQGNPRYEIRFTDQHGNKHTGRTESNIMDAYKITGSEENATLTFKNNPNGKGVKITGFES